MGIMNSFINDIFEKLAQLKKLLDLQDTTISSREIQTATPRGPDSDFNCDGLVLIHNDETIRQIIQLLVTKGIVDIYVDQKVEEDGSPKVNDDTKVNVEGAVIEAFETDIEGLEAVGVEGYYDLRPEIEALEAVGEELRTTVEEFVLEPLLMVGQTRLLMEKIMLLMVGQGGCC
ncbi:hypothetical protein V6N13_068575 [Hibiscus sabdariffa]